MEMLSCPGDLLFENKNILIKKESAFDCGIEEKRGGTINFPECCYVHNSCQEEKGIHHREARALFSRGLAVQKSSMKM